MGAKIPEHLKTRQPTCKCDVCGGNFLSIQALRSHQACAHPRTSKRVAYRPKIEVIARRKLVPEKKTTKTDNMNVKLVKINAEEPVSGAVSTVREKTYNTRKTEFECPVCSKIFKVYFSAYRHIQNNHCVNDNGEPVPPNSSDLIQPTRIELCSTCNKRVATNLPHSCSVRDEEIVSKNYTCLGCEQSFASPHMFKVHIPGLHCDEAESFTFPDFSTYTEWKEDMETQTKIKYVKLSTKHKNDMYHCNHILADEKITHFCPSSLSIQQSAKKVRVMFFEEHFGHDFNAYKIPEKYKKYLTSLDDSEMETVAKSKDNVEIYGQFKQVMNDIILSSEKIDVNELKMLLGKALEMSSTLKMFNKHVPDVNKSITDDEITKLLDKPVRKRKMDIGESVAKRLRRDRDSASQHSDSDTPKKENDTATVKELKTYTNPKKLLQPKEDVKKVEVQSPSSFSESYKNFVDASYKSVEKNTDSPSDKSKTKTKVETKKKEIVKTKVGQFKPVSPRGTNVLKVKPNILSRDKRVHINESPKVNKVVPDKVSMSPKEKGPIKSILSKEPKAIKPDGTKETKVVQIKMEESPDKFVNELNLPKIDPDFEYEIKEQENDCNILIIKI